MQMQSNGARMQCRCGAVQCNAASSSRLSHKESNSLHACHVLSIHVPVRAPLHLLMIQCRALQCKVDAYYCSNELTAHINAKCHMHVITLLLCQLPHVDCCRARRPDCHMQAAAVHRCCAHAELKAHTSSCHVPMC